MGGDKILYEIVKDKKWILEVIESCKSEDQLSSCKNIIKTWSNRIRGLIENYDCPFYKYKEIKKINHTYKNLEYKYYSKIQNKIFDEYNY
jgi:hypothetical protein